MHDPTGDRVAAMAIESDGLRVLDVDQELSVQDQEELVLVVVLVPVELALDDAEPNDRVVDGRQGLVEPRLGARGDLGGMSISVE